MVTDNNVGNKINFSNNFGDDFDNNSVVSYNDLVTNNLNENTSVYDNNIKSSISFKSEFELNQLHIYKKNTNHSISKKF